MKRANLSAPLAVNPSTGTRLRLLSYRVDCRSRTLSVHYQLVHTDGSIRTEAEVHVRGADVPLVETYIGNQEDTILNRLAAYLGVSITTIETES